MKIIATTVLLSFLFTPFAYAQTTTPAKTPTVSPGTTEVEKEQKLIDQINNLKEKVASKVAELKLVEKRGVIGIVSQVSGNKITITDVQDTTRFIDVDELTKFSSPGSKETFGISDITKDTKLSVIGLYNKQSKRILGRFIETVTIPVFVTGVVTEVDKANFTATIVSEDQVKHIIDVENITRTSTYTTEDDIVKAGFSKITVGDRAHVMGYADTKEKDRVTATRILLFPELPKNPKIVVPEVKVEENTTPSPTKKVTPTPEEE